MVGAPSVARPTCPNCGSRALRTRVTKTNPVICAHCGYEGKLNEFEIALKLPERPRFLSDGVLEVSEIEFESFPARILNKGGNEGVDGVRRTRFGVSFPLEISNKLSLKHGMFVEVAIRKVPLSYLSKTYGPLKKVQGAYSLGVYSPLRVICPKCKRMGTLNKRKDSLVIMHGKRDGVLERTDCSISSKKYPEEAKVFATLLGRTP